VAETLDRAAGSVATGRIIAETPPRIDTDRGRLIAAIDKVDLSIRL
jgi:hypothetical protein